MQLRAELDGFAPPAPPAVGWQPANTGIHAAPGWSSVPPAPIVGGTGSVAGGPPQTGSVMPPAPTQPTATTAAATVHEHPPGAVTGQVHGWYTDRAGAATDRRACETTVEGQMPWHGISAPGPLPTHSRPPLTSWTDHQDRGRRSRREDRSRSPLRRRQRRDRSSSSETSDDEEDDVDRRREHQLAPTRSKIAAAPASLRLPAITTRAERRLRHRRNYVTVADSVDRATGAPATVLEYLGGVAGILAHTTYHFPQCGLQVAGYLAWLLSRSSGRSLREIQAADSRARQAMALRPRDFLTALELDQFLSPAAPVARTTGEGGGRQVCYDFLRGSGCSWPCRTARYHPPCRTCGSQLHPSNLHGAVTFPGTAIHRGRGGRPGPPRYGGAPGGR